MEGLQIIFTMGSYFLFIFFKALNERKKNITVSLFRASQHAVRYLIFQVNIDSAAVPSLNRNGPADIHWMCLSSGCFQNMCLRWFLPFWPPARNWYIFLSFCPRVLVLDGLKAEFRIYVLHFPGKKVNINKCIVGTSDNGVELLSLRLFCVVFVFWNSVCARPLMTKSRDRPT